MCYEYYEIEKAKTVKPKKELRKRVQKSVKANSRVSTVLTPTSGYQFINFLH